MTPGAWYVARMLESLDAWPINVALLGKGNTVGHEALHEQVLTGISGFKLHEDWGSTPAAIDACLRVADQTGVQVAIHTDTLNEAGYVQDTLAAIAGRGIHAYHTEGAGGGHAPDIITVAGQPHVLPSSTNPTRPHTVNTVDEHLDMLMVCHHLKPTVPEDLAFAESRIRPSTIAAEDLLHDLGAISMIGSDSQAMGRVGEVPLRTWQTAHVGKKRWGALPGDGPADNLRAQRYVAKYTICPAIAHGLDARGRLGRAGQARGPGALRAGVLRREALAGDQGRDDRLRRDGRRERVDPDAAAGAAAADVRGGRGDGGGDVGALRRAAGAGGRPRRPAGRAAAAGPGARHPPAHQGGHAEQRRAAADRGGARHVHGAGRRRGGGAVACGGPADGPAVLPVLMLPLLLLADSRLPSGGTPALDRPPSSSSHLANSCSAAGTRLDNEHYDPHHPRPAAVDRNCGAGGLLARRGARRGRSAVVARGRGGDAGSHRGRPARLCACPRGAVRDADAEAACGRLAAARRPRHAAAQRRLTTPAPAADRRERR